MAKKLVREIARHDCEDDDGNEYVVVELQHFIVFEPVSGERRELPGPLEYRLSEGGDVEWKSKDTFEILESEKLIQRI